MKKLIIKLLNKINSIREDINKQEDNTNIEDILHFFLNKYKINN